MAWLWAGPMAGAAERIGFPVVTEYSGSETGIHGAINDAVQDEQGRLFFAGTRLLTFDGDHWKNTAFAGVYGIRRLAIGRDNKLWAGGFGELGWFEETPNHEWQFHSLIEQLPPEARNMGDVWAIHPDATGVTFVTNTRILRWSDGKFNAWVLPGAERLWATKNQDTLFVHQTEVGLFTVGADGPRPFISREILGNLTVGWVERRASDWLIGSSDGFFTFDGHQLVPFATEITGFLKRARFVRACRLPDGRLVIGTASGGMVFLLPDGRVDYYWGADDGLPSSYVVSFLVGRDQELWVTTGSSILRVDIASRSTVFDGRSGLPRQPFRTLTAWKGSVYIAGEAHVYALDRGQTRFSARPALDGRWQNLHAYHDRIVLVGMRGAKSWDGHTLRVLRAGLFDSFAATPTTDDPATLLLAEDRTILSLPANGAAPRAVISQLPALPTSLVHDASGRLWIGTQASGVWGGALVPHAATLPEAVSGTRGLPLVRGKTFVRRTTTNDIVVISDTGAWFKQDGSATFAAVEHYRPRPIAAVSEVASDDSVWIAYEGSTSAAPNVGRMTSANGTWLWEIYAVSGLAEIGALRNIMLDTSDPVGPVLWITGTTSVLRNVLGGETSAPTPRPPLLRAFASADERGTRQRISAALPFSVAGIDFEFAAPEYSRRRLFRIETRIDGLDADWIPAGPGSRRELTAIRDGKYTVRARVVAETGAISPETSFAFQVLPPWWRTTPMMAVFVLATLPVGYGAYVIRIRTLRRRNSDLEKKVRERTEQLEAASAAKTQFVANMSHDIRNPLNGIVGLALALEDTRLDKRQREMVATLRECTTYLSSLVDDVLDFASIEAGRVELRPGPYVPHELLRSIVETLKADTAERGALLLVEADPAIPANVLGDAGRIQQILVNFVSNALKYAGGHIRVSVMVPANSPGELEFSVTDEGPGISPAEQATLFTKFTRLARVSGKDIPGTGLGLAACRLLADIMGGSVGVDSGIGQGARFFLRLPLTVTEAPSKTPVAALPNTTVLLVEDTDYNAWAAEAVLGKLGLTCERARSGEEALRLFREKRYNVVLLDRNLPDMDGTDVARRMRQIESDGLQAVILAVTAYCTAEDRAVCLDAGMDAFVGKPLTPEKLRKVLLAASRRLLAAPPLAAKVDPAVAAIDFTLLEFLAEGAPDALAAQIQRFTETLDNLDAELVAAFRAPDFGQLATTAHGIVGQAKMVNATLLATAAAALEAAAREEKQESAAHYFEGTRAESRNLKAAMLRRRSSVPTT